MSFSLFTKDKPVPLDKFIFSYKVSFWLMGSERWGDNALGHCGSMGLLENKLAFLKKIIVFIFRVR